ncbi:MAG: RHS repeat-associated core domain-containing protein, partial [Erysipelotrichales bacterium]|nr:RHS repeat-associated core domain-containing protein [Erysipelotrichales bacterium]
EGKRISKSDGTNTFEYFYADGKLTRIKRNNTTLHFDYDMLGPSVIRYNGVDYYYHRNAQGDIDGISNAAGELVASYRYDAWGKPLSITGTMASTIGVLNPFRYRGYVYDEETGLYYLNSRYYDPEVGRFISPDSVSYLGADGTILGYDLYTYCDNDPVNHRDSEGNLWNFVIGGLVGGIVGGISAAVSSYKTTGSVSLASVAIGAASGIIGGLIGASGLDPIKQAVTSGLLSFGTNVSNQLVNNGNDWGEVKWGDALIDGAITAGCSWIGGRITAKAKNEAEALIDKGSKRFVQGVKKMVYGKKNFVKVMKQGIDWLQTGDKNRNIAQGTASVIGSITNGIISLGKSIFGSGK